MKVTLHSDFTDSVFASDATDIINACVHCGFCNATCPTYLERGDERDGPRGRIYLIKQFLETGESPATTRTHLDRCLTCRNCETTCPSGVEYGKLLDIARPLVEHAPPRSLPQRAIRKMLLLLLPYPRRFGPLLRLGQTFRVLLPGFIKHHVPPRQKAINWPQPKHARVMLALEGCAQATATPNTNAATAKVLDRLGISLITGGKAGCCGAANYHLSDHERGLDMARRNIDSWWPAIEQGAEAIVMTASGCGVMVKDYGELLATDSAYAEKAKRVSELTRDLSVILTDENLSALTIKASTASTALHCPCTLQHGQRMPDTLEQLLKTLGVNLAETDDKHLCCGSAGTYSILQPRMARQLRDNKLQALTVNQPERIVTANVGCQMHLGGGSDVPVDHWIELIEEMSRPSAS